MNSIWYRGDGGAAASAGASVPDADDAVLAALGALAAVPTCVCARTGTADTDGAFGSLHTFTQMHKEA